MEAIKAITLWQPWASLIAVGAKKYETRGWATNYRGPIAIHAALRDPIKALDNVTFDAWDAMQNALGIESFYAWDASLGTIIATAELVGCWGICNHIGQVALRRNEDAYKIITGNELLFGDWTPGRYAWELANVKMLPEPIPAKGKQGLWNWERTA